jgi:hypothetical protein
VDDQYLRPRHCLHHFLLPGVTNQSAEASNWSSRCLSSCFSQFLAIYVCFRVKGSNGVSMCGWREWLTAPEE